MQRPSFQFYPADWQANKNLRRCTHAEKGIWIDVMCLMHDSEEYGILRWPLDEIAQAVNCEVADLLSLSRKGVLKGADPGETCEAYVYTPRSGRQDGPPVILLPEQTGPIWYSSRFVRDEYKRLHSGGETRFKPKQAKPSPSQRQGEWQGETPGQRQGDGASSSSSTSSSDKTNEHEEEVRTLLRDEQAMAPTAVIEDYLKGKVQALILSQYDYTEVSRWVDMTGGNLDVIKSGIDAGLQVFRQDHPGQVPRGAKFYKGYVETAWGRHQALTGGAQGGRATSGTGGTYPDTPGVRPGQGRAPAAGPQHKALGRGAEASRKGDGGFSALSVRE